ncbi:hypothetical protein KUM39_19300 [Streptomyces sp. J2-1]|nr:hypothetical protein [Streptomyces corallincola]
MGSSSKPSETDASKAEPVTGAGFDPAFIPGLTAPAKAPAPAAPAAEEEPADAAPEPAPAEAPEETVPDGPADGPAFEASDRRARFAADHRGVRLRLDEEDCEFRWHEIAAVETETARFGKRFTITVHTPDSRWYPIEIEAKSRSDFATWESELDAVLDAYFEEA